MADPNKIVYQIWPRSFMDSNGDGIGDLRGVIQKLDHIASLGADLIWLSPVYPSPNCDYGYDIADYYDINPEFGTLADFDELICEAKKRGIGILMDLVANHTSDKCEWFQKALEGPESEYRDWYYFRDGKNGGPPNNWMSFFGGSAWTLDEKSGQYYLTMFAPGQCDLNWDNSAVREAIYAVMRFWLDRGVSGFRMDVINAIKKAEGLPDKDPGKRGLQFPAELICDREGVHDFLREMNREVLSKYDCFTVGEGALTPLSSVIRYTKPENSELMMMFQFDLHMLGCGPLGKFDFRKLYRWTMKDFKDMLFYWHTGLEAGGGRIGNYLSNHDQPRHVSRFGDDKKYRRECARAFALVNLTLPGTPFIYQGEECGMTNSVLPIEDWKDFEAVNSYHQLSAMLHVPRFIARRIVMKMTRDHARTPVQWDSSRNAGFTAGTPWQKLNPNYTTVNMAAESGESGIVEFYKMAAGLYKSSRAIREGSFTPLLRDHKTVLGYIRELPGERILVLANLSSRSACAALPFDSSGAQCLLATEEPRALEGKMKLRPWEAGAWRLP